MPDASRINIDAVDGPELVGYVERELSKFRSLRDIAMDFQHADGRFVDRTTLVNRLRFAEPDTLIEYRAAGVLLRHRRVPERRFPTAADTGG